MRCVLAVVLPSLLACSAPAQKGHVAHPERVSAVAPAPASPQPVAGRPLDAGKRRVASRAHGLRLVVPAREGWRKGDGIDWLVLEHALERSVFRIRLSSAARLVTPDECLADARLRRPELPELEDYEIIERRSLSAPAGFDGTLVVAVREVGPELHGYVVASGAAVGRCFAAFFSSTESGPERDAVIGRRLQGAVEALDSVEVVRIEDRLR